MEPLPAPSTAARRRNRGTCALEVGLLLPWYVFLFIGAFDWGIYARGLISTENAARVAVHYTATDMLRASDQDTACKLVLEELRAASDTSGSNGCKRLPVIVTAQQVTGPDGKQASEVAVTYQTQQLLPMPFVLGGSATFYRTAQMRLVNTY